MSWEYEALFNRMDSGDISGEPKQLDMWSSQPTSIKIGQMGYRTKTTWAGEHLEAEVYPIFGKRDRAQAREKVKQVTREAQQKINNRNAEHRLILLAETNFTSADYHITLTYAIQPTTEKRAVMDINNFFNRIRRMREKRSLPPLKYIYAMGGGEAEDEKNIHFHVLINGGIDRDEIERCWKKTPGAGLTNADRLQMEDGLTALMKYFFKQHKDRKKEPGEQIKRWVSSKNLKKPKTTTSDSRCSNARVKRIAHDIRNEAKSEMEKVYPGYRFIDIEVRYSDLIDGVYIKCVMRKNRGENHDRL